MDFIVPRAVTSERIVSSGIESGRELKGLGRILPTTNKKSYYEQTISRSLKRKGIPLEARISLAMFSFMTIVQINEFALAEDISSMKQYCQVVAII